MKKNKQNLARMLLNKHKKKTLPLVKQIGDEIQHSQSLIRQHTPSDDCVLALPMKLQRDSQSVLLSERVLKEQKLTGGQASPAGKSFANSNYDDLNIEMFHVDQGTDVQFNAEYTEISV